LALDMRQLLEMRCPELGRQVGQLVRFEHPSSSYPPLPSFPRWSPAGAGGPVLDGSITVPNGTIFAEPVLKWSSRFDEGV
jgi:hypothetical protein